MRAKFKVQSVTDTGSCHLVRAIPVCDNTIPENTSFNTATPSGQEYYVDFTPATEASNA